ncbi:hypothetical protein NQD34_011438 [Periophthalmus magnuspinnatus]|nr:hypothetical protein NQD34_011438 [Periophthalmus magnuspinnatus]
MFLCFLCFIVFVSSVFVVKEKFDSVNWTEAVSLLVQVLLLQFWSDYSWTLPYIRLKGGGANDTEPAACSSLIKYCVLFLSLNRAALCRTPHAHTSAPSQGKWNFPLFPPLCSHVMHRNDSVLHDITPDGGFEVSDGTF